MLDSEVRRRAAGVRLVLMDVDGVLTDGRLVYGPDGEEWKVFHVRDGAGIKLAQRSGLRIGIISGRRSDALERRATELGVEEFHQGAGEKLSVYEAILQRGGLTDAEVCFIGDDIVDLPVMRRAGLPAAPADAHPEAIAAAALVSRLGGGQGAIREILDFILRAQGTWEAALAPYRGPTPAPGSGGQ